MKDANRFLHRKNSPLQTCLFLLDNARWECYFYFVNLFCLTIWGVFPLHFFASIVRQWSKMQHPVAAGNRKIYRRQKMGFVLIHIAYFFPKATRCVILFLLHFNKFFKTLLTHSTCRGIFLVNPIDFVDWFKFIHKMWSCSFWTQPQKVVGYHRETHHFREEKSTKELTAPQHIRFILPPIHPTKSSLRCVGGIFLFHK